MKTFKDKWRWTGGDRQEKQDLVKFQHSRVLLVKPLMQETATDHISYDLKMREQRRR